jgi:CRISPR-associated protein Cas2
MFTKIELLKKVCNKYLNHIQNSVFEGVLNNVNYRELIEELNVLLDHKTDSIIIFKIDNPKWIEKTVMGLEKNNTTNIIL